MSAAENSAGSEGREPFAESDDQATRMIYDTGGLPAFIAVVWLGLLVAFVTYLVTYGIPDLKAWFQ